MRILVTGAAGFIGFHVVQSLAASGHYIIGIDNINNYYDVNLKFARLAESGISNDDIIDNKPVKSSTFPTYYFVKIDITDANQLNLLFLEHKFTHVINLAAQAGVRYSLENPLTYIQTNILGFTNLLEACRYGDVKHLVYASSSSVYGDDAPVPYKESDPANHPVSLYAVTKKTNELLAYSYSKLFGIPTTGIRFFTVYGPWGRPDMAPWLFLSAITKSEPVKVFNNGNMERDFTYIDDIVEGVLRILHHPPEGEIPQSVYNIGCSSPVNLLKFIRIIEQVVGHEALIKLADIQPGDVHSTYADTSKLESALGYRPTTTVEKGVLEFYKWYRAHSAHSYKVVGR